MLTKSEKFAVQVKHQLTALACVLSICSVVPNVTQALSFSSIKQVYFFGDSLTDSGFYNDYTAALGIPDKAPTFTTFGGYTWAQYVARDLKDFSLPVGPFPTVNDEITGNVTPLNPGPSTAPVIPDLTGIDYACGGSKTISTEGNDFIWAPSLQQQVEYHLSISPDKLDRKAVYFIWSGANDLLAALSKSPLPTTEEFIQIVDDATTGIASQVTALEARGARRVVVLSLPDIGATPFVSKLAQDVNDPTLPGSMKRISFVFNSLLNMKLAAISSRNKVKILYFDTFTALDHVIQNTKNGNPTVVNGQSFLFTDYLNPVCTASSAIACLESSEDHIFADSVHPTDMAHRVLSLEIERQIKLWV